MKQLFLRYLACIGVSLTLTLPAVSQDAHVYFIAATGNNVIYGLNFHNGAWSGPVTVGNADGGTALAGLTIGETEAHVYHILNGHIYDSSCCWSQVDLTVKAGAPAPLESTPLAAVSVDGGHAIYYETSDSHIHFISNSPNKGVGWHDRDLTTATDGVLASGSAFSAAATGPLTVNLFFVANQSNHVHQLVNNGDGNVDQDLTAMSGTTTDAADLGVGSFYRGSDNTIHVFYTDGEQVNELAWSSSTGWKNSKLPCDQFSCGNSSPAQDTIFALVSNGGGKNVFYHPTQAPDTKDLIWDFSSGDSWSTTVVNVGQAPLLTGPIEAITGTAGTSSIPEKVLFLGFVGNECDVFDYTVQTGSVTNLSFNLSLPEAWCPQGFPRVSSITSFLF